MIEVGEVVEFEICALLGFYRPRCADTEVGGKVEMKVTILLTSGYTGSRTWDLVIC